MDRRPHLLLASRSFLGDGRTCDVATTTKTTSRLSDRYLPETIEHDVTHTRRPVRQNRPVSTSRRPPGPLTSDEAQPLRSPLQITARRTICSVSGPKKPRTIQLLFIARQHSRACGARCRYIISLRLSNAGIVSIRLYKSCRQTFYTVSYGRQSTFHTLQCHIVKIFERKGGL